MNGQLSIRLACGQDLSSIVDIYNHEVLHATSTFATEPVTLASHQAWLDAHQESRYPAIVAELSPVARPAGAPAGHPTGPAWIAGFGSVSPWSPRQAYARTAEVSVYVHRDARQQGIGRAILADLIARARTAGLGVLLARICAEGQASLRLHQALGFRPIGTMRRVGRKFGRLLDVELYDLQLDGPKDPHISH